MTSKVFSNSSINKMLRNGEMPATFQTVIPGCEKVPNYLICDPVYPLTPFCMKEFDNCNSDEEVILNNIFRSARNQIECSFGCLKARCAILTRKIDSKLEILSTVIYEVVKSQIEILKNNEENYKNVPDPMIVVSAR